MHPKLVNKAVDESTKAILDRLYRLEDACIAIQRDDPIKGLWCHQNPKDFDEVWQKPSDVAKDEEGLQRVLTRLADVAPTLGPAQWRPKLKGQRRANRRCGAGRFGSQGVNEV